jgi:hypothetical protein
VVLLHPLENRPSSPTPTLMSTRPTSVTEETKTPERDGSGPVSGSQETHAITVEARREFLAQTATILVRSRLNELEELKSTVDQLGLVLSRLREVRTLIDGATSLHAHLESKVAREIDEVTKLNMDPGSTAVPRDVGSFSDRFTRHIEMLMK